MHSSPIYVPWCIPRDAGRFKTTDKLTYFQRMCQLMPLVELSWTMPFVATVLNDTCCIQGRHDKGEECLKAPKHNFQCEEKDHRPHYWSRLPNNIPSQTFCVVTENKVETVLQKLLASSCRHDAILSVFSISSYTCEEIFNKVEGSERIVFLSFSDYTNASRRF